MPGISFQELVCVLLLLLVIVNPKDLPRLCRELGRLYANLQHYLRRIRLYTRESINAISHLDLPEKDSAESSSAEIQLETGKEESVSRKN